MASKRRGMLIKNTNDRPVELGLANRSVHLNPGEEQLITAEEVRDPMLRAKLQVRAVSIVRPATEEEEAALKSRLDKEAEETNEG